MGKKKVIAVCLIVLLLSTGVVFAANVNGDYKGFPIVKVNLNGEPVASTVPATNFYGSTVLPLRAVAEALGTTVDWDPATSTANLTKIGVSMVMCESVEWKDDTYSIKNVYSFPFTPADYSYTFSVFYDSDAMPKTFKEGTYSTRVVICDKAGDVLVTGTETPDNVSSYGFWGSSDFTNVVFPEVGEYVLECQMKAAGGNYQTVATRKLIAEEETE